MPKKASSSSAGRWSAASTFTAVPGLGGAGMGAIGLAAAVLAANQSSAERWLVVWLVAAAVALAIGVTSMWRKAARLGAPLAGAVGRRFAISFAAPLVAGAALTWGVWMHDDWALMPPVWLLLYGTGVLAGGVFSVAAVRLLGLAFMALGVAALVTPPAWGNVWLGIGFRWTAVRIRVVHREETWGLGVGLRWR